MKTSSAPYSFSPPFSPNNCSRSLHTGKYRLRCSSLKAILAWVLVTSPGICLTHGAGTPELNAPGVGLFQPPVGAKKFSISLAMVENQNRPSGYLVQRSTQPLEELTSVPPSIAQAYAGKEFFACQIAALPDGTRFVAVLNQDTGAKFLNRNDPGMMYSRVYRINGAQAEPVLVTEGYQSMGGDVTIPVQLQLPGLGTTKVTSLRTEIGYSVNGSQNGKPQVYSGRGEGFQVTGSMLTREGKVSLTVTIPEEMTVTPNTQVAVRFEPIEPGLPERIASGKVTDFLTLDGARLAVTALASDFSSATLAVVSGSLEQTLERELQLGTEMPAFAQMDLVSHRTIAREEILAKIRKSPGVIFIFADLLPMGAHFGGPYMPPYQPGGTASLPLPADEVVAQANLNLDPKPLVVLVTRQLPLSFLYEELRNKNPEYLVLADFVDPLRTLFRLPGNNPGPWYGSFPANGNDPCLRQLFNLPGNTLSIVSFDSQGKVLYVKADVGKAFLTSLAEARSSLTGKSNRSTLPKTGTKPSPGGEKTAR